MADIQINQVKLGTTFLDQVTIVNDNFANLDAGKLDIDGTAANASKVNNHTVEVDVPSTAVFLTQEEKDALATKEDVAGDLTYTNSTEIVQGLGGISVGETFDKVTITAMLDKLLYPYVAPVVSVSIAPNGGTYEKGSTVNVTSLKVNVTKKAREITKVEAKNGSTVLATVTENVGKGGSFDCLPAGGLSVTENTTFTGIATDSDNKTKSANSSSFTFVDPFYYGVVANGTEITSDVVKGLTKDVSAKASKTYSYTTENSCMVIAYPKSYGVLKSALDPNKFENIASYTQSTVTVAALSGNVDYYVYVKSPSTASGFKIAYSF